MTEKVETQEVHVIGSSLAEIVQYFADDLIRQGFTILPPGGLEKLVVDVARSTGDAIAQPIADRVAEYIRTSEPTPVRVVEMPIRERTSVQTVKRDAKGFIESVVEESIET